MGTSSGPDRGEGRSDQELISAAAAGDAGAFAALYHRYRDWVVRLGWRFCGNEADALDVLQETFAYVLRRLPDLQLTAKMTTFLYPAVRNLSIARRRNRGRAVGMGEEIDELPASEQPAETSGELAAVVAGLPGGQRQVVLMRFVDDMSLQEIAAALGIPLGTVKSRLHNALEALRADPRVREHFL